MMTDTPSHIFSAINNYLEWSTTNFVKEKFWLGEFWLSIIASLAFSTPVFWCRDFHSRVFQPCFLVPRIPLPPFPLLHFLRSRVFHSRVFSRPATRIRIHGLTTNLCRENRMTSQLVFNIHTHTPACDEETNRTVSRANTELKSFLLCFAVCLLFIQNKVRRMQLQIIPTISSTVQVLQSW